HHLREDGRRPAPRPDHFLVPALTHQFDLAEQLWLDKRPFFQRTRHHSLRFTLPTLTTTPHDILLGALVAPGFQPHRRLAPGGLGAGHTDGRTPFTAAMRVAVGIHRRTAHGWAPPEPALAARLAELDIAVVGVAHLADSRHAVLVHAANLAARQAKLG